MIWLKSIRLAVGMSGTKVAELAGITQQHYSLIETGVRCPSVDVAKRIADVLGFEWTRFFEDERGKEMTMKKTRSKRAGAEDQTGKALPV